MKVRARSQLLLVAGAIGCAGQRIPAEEICVADGWVHHIILDGVDTCESAVLDARVIASIGPNQWLVEDCPCGQICASPSQHELRIEFTEPGLDFVAPTPCVQIELHRDGCELAGAVIRDTSRGGELLLATGHQATMVHGFEDIEVSIFADRACGDQRAFGLRFTAEQHAVELLPNSVAQLETSERVVEIALGRADEGLMSYSLRPLAP